MSLIEKTFGKGDPDSKTPAEEYMVYSKERVFDIQRHIVLGYKEKFINHKKRENIEFINRVCSSIYESLLDQNIKKSIARRGPLFMIDKNPYKLKEFSKLIDRNKDYKKKTGFAENPTIPGFLNMSTFYKNTKIKECIITHEYGHTIFHNFSKELDREWRDLYDLYNVKNDDYDINAWIFKRNASECFSEVLQIYLNVTHRGYATGGIFCENMHKLIPKMYEFMKKIMIQTFIIRDEIYKNNYNVKIEDTIDIKN